MGKRNSRADVKAPENLKQLLELSSDEQSFWRQLISSISEPMFIVDADKKIVYYNRTAEDLTGFTQAEVLGQPCIVGVRCVNCLLDCELFRTGEVRDKHLELVTNDGRIIKVVKNARVIRDKDGNVIAGVETFRDVTAEHEILENAENARRLADGIIDSLADGLVAVDERGLIVHMNAEMEQLLGTDAREYIGKPLGSLVKFSAGDGAPPYKPTSMITSVQTKNGEERRVDIRTQALSIDGRQAGSLILFRHITPSERVRDQLQKDSTYRGIISRSPAMTEIFNLVETIADSDVTVLIEGESGTGKELLARAVHAASSRRDHPFHVVNCAVFNENLLESELFGHCRGAFTGAVADRAGRFEMAHQGTLFLDEIGELPPNLQVKLLRFLQNREFERVGEVRTRRVDVRIIAATNRDLREAIRQGVFRDDLYYRLNVIPITLPPLRERLGDIVLLAAHFVETAAIQHGRSAAPITEEAFSLLNRHPWPGNVRELENVMLHAITCSAGRPITMEHLPRYLHGHADKPSHRNNERPRTIEDAERETILKTLQDSGFNRSRAAAALGITRTTLWRKMKHFQLIP